jgi:hypothetical protein
MHSAKKPSKNSNVSLCQSLTQVCALVQNITTTADKGNKAVTLYTNSHFQPATLLYLLFTVPTCFGHNKMEVKFVYIGKAHRKCKVVIVQTMKVY